jgi:hypothetical protein
MPLLMMNILIAILGHTYVNVKDKWAENMYYQKVSIIYDLELLMFWNKHKETDKFHLLYAKNLNVEDETNFRTLNLRIKQNHKKVKKEQKENFDKMNSKIESLKDEVKQTMRSHIKSHKECLNSVKDKLDKKINIEKKDK